jgi:hypothetical protein
MQGRQKRRLGSSSESYTYYYYHFVPLEKKGYESMLSNYLKSCPKMSFRQAQPIIQ